MKSGFVRGYGMDKWEAYRPSGTQFIQTESYISDKSEKFSVRRGYAWDYQRKRRGFTYGVDKKLYHASGSGILIDTEYVGKTDE